MLRPCPEGTSLGWPLQVAHGLQAAGPFLGGWRVPLRGRVQRSQCCYLLRQVEGLTFLQRPVCGDSLSELGVLQAEHLGVPLGTSSLLELGVLPPTAWGAPYTSS